MSSKTLTITDDKVLEAAAKCGTAKEVLKVLFPEAFGGREIPSTQIKVELESHGEYGSDIRFYHDGKQVCFKVFKS